MFEQSVNDGIKTASMNDALWFEANPSRKLRLRDRIEGEYSTTEFLPPADGFTNRTLVIQARPGVRIRHPVAVFSYIRNEEASDSQLFAFFEDVINFQMRDFIAKLGKAEI